MSQTKLQRRAVIRARLGWWKVSMYGLGRFLGNLSWPTWPEARDAALRWTGQTRP